MNIAKISKVHEQIVKDILWAHEQEMQNMRQRIEQLERKLQPTDVIGFHAKEGERQLGTAFKNVKYNLYD